MPMPCHGADDRGEQQHDTEMNDVRRPVRLAGLRPIAGERDLRNQGHHDELQSDQRAGGRADNDVEVFPAFECCHASGRSLRGGSQSRDEDSRKRLNDPLKQFGDGSARRGSVCSVGPPASAGQSLVLVTNSFDLTIIKSRTVRRHDDHTRMFGKFDGRVEGRTRPFSTTPATARGRRGLRARWASTDAKAALGGSCGAASCGSAAIWSSFAYRDAFR